MSYHWSIRDIYREKKKHPDYSLYPHTQCIDLIFSIKIKGDDICHSYFTVFFFCSKTLLKIKYIELKITASNDMADLF